MDSETSLQETSTQLVSESISQQNTTSVPSESESQSQSQSTLGSVCPPDQIETNKEHNLHLVGAASRDMPRPVGVKKAKYQRRRRNQQFNDGQTLGSDRIVAALMVINERAEERSRRQEKLKRRRYEILDQRYEEQEWMAKRKHAITMCIKRTQIVKDFKYILDELLEAYKDLESINPSSLMTPRERFEYEQKREWVEILELQHAEIKLVLATTTTHSRETRFPTIRAPTSGIAPRPLDDEDLASCGR